MFVPLPFSSQLQGTDKARSARNFMIYQRGTTQSYQQWADAVGDDSYTFDNFDPYFRKSVSFTPPDTTKRAANSSVSFKTDSFDTPSKDKPLQVSYANYAGPFSSWMEKAFREIGLPQTEDFQSGKLEGSTYCASTIDPENQSRSSSQSAFLEYAKDEKFNLKVYSLATAKKILFDGNKKATGVLVKSRTSTYTLSARKEVILSAGAFQSPQLLMVSGIGPKETLQKFDIPVIKDAPGVGQNMWDHIFFGPSYRVNVPTYTDIAHHITQKIIGAYFTQYKSKKEGPLTNPVCDYLGWEKIPASLRSTLPASALADLAKFPEDWPEIEFLSGPGYIANFSDLLSEQPNDGYQYATILTALVAPTSRGTVTISSSDTDDLPIIDPAWLTSTTDQAVAIAAFKRSRAAFNSKAMAPVLTDPEEYFPGNNVTTDAVRLSPE
jgi:choline dehydrogenase